jgi:methyltransferase (TIGR00027 family)
MAAATGLTGVGVTALMSAYARAQESLADKPLFDDPLAVSFLAAAAQAATGGGGQLPWPAQDGDGGTPTLWSDIYGYFTNRTPFYDRYLARQLAGGCRQVVILGAGLDARPFRLEIPAGTTVYEIDTAPVLDFKESVLARYRFTCAAARVPVPADLRGNWDTQLTAAGFRPAQPTAWLAEGLLMHFTAREADDLLAMLSARSAPGSGLAGEVLNRPYRVTDSPVAGADDLATAQMFAAAACGGLPEGPGSWLARYGWSARLRDFTQEVAALGRPQPRHFRPDRPDPLRLWLFTAELGKRGRSRRRQRYRS